MTWQGILGHDDVAGRFQSAVARGRLGSTFLFVGPAGIGKATFARRLAATLLCHDSSPERFAACEQCESCRRIASGTHPDFIVVSKPPDKAQIPLALLIGSDDAGAPVGLCEQISLRPALGSRRVALIDDADELNEEGANALLKTLEEPPPHSVLILISTNLDRQLPTIRSRSQIVRFAPLAEEHVAELLTTTGVVSDPTQTAQLAQHSGGSLAAATELADATIWELRAILLHDLSQPRLESVGLSRRITASLDEHTGEASLKRRRMRQAFGFVAEFYRQLLRGLSGQQVQGDPSLQTAVAALQTSWNQDHEAAARCVERTLEAAEQVERFVHPATLVSAWAEALGKLSRGEA